MKITKAYICLCILVVLLVLSGCSGDLEETNIYEPVEAELGAYEPIEGIELHTPNPEPMPNHEFTPRYEMQERYIGDIEDRTFLVPIPTVEGYFDVRELYRSLIDFYTEPVREEIHFEHVTVHHASSRFISMEAVFRTPLIGLFTFFSNFVTVDLEQGREVFLNDLIDVNDEFIRLLYGGYLLRCDFNHTETGCLIGMINNEEGLRHFLDDASRPIRRNYNFTAYHPDVLDITGMLFIKPSFFLAPNRLYFAYFSPRPTHTTRCFLYINLEDIEQFLNVDKW